MHSIFGDGVVIDRTQRMSLQNRNNDLVYLLGGVNGVESYFRKALIFSIIGAKP